MINKQPCYFDCMLQKATQKHLETMEVYASEVFTEGKAKKAWGNTVIASRFETLTVTIKPVTKVK